MLRVDYAFHSRQMDPFEAELRASLKSLASQRPDIPFYSTVTGTPAEAGELNADYWWRNMRCPVLFRTAVEAAIDDGFNTFVELGAHPVLAGPVRSCLAHSDREGTVVGSLHRDEPDMDYMARSLAELHVSGVAARLGARGLAELEFRRSFRASGSRSRCSGRKSEGVEIGALRRAGPSAARLSPEDRGAELGR